MMQNLSVRAGNSTHAARQTTATRDQPRAGSCPAGVVEGFLDPKKGICLNSSGPVQKSQQGLDAKCRQAEPLTTGLAVLFSQEGFCLARSETVICDLCMISGTVGCWQEEHAVSARPATAKLKLLDTRHASGEMENALRRG